MLIFITAMATNGEKIMGTPNTVSMVLPPNITSGPTNVTVIQGNTAVFSVTAGGTGTLSYQWLFNGMNLPNNIITTVAGNGTTSYSGDGGAATNASLYNPNGVAVDTSGNLFIADIFNNAIRKVTTNGLITTVAGNGSPGDSGDGGTATNASLYNPSGVAVDAGGNLFIADARIREVTTDGRITTVAGNGIYGFGGDGSAATNAFLANPGGVTVDASGNLFIADTFNSRIRKVTANGIIMTVAGNGTNSYSGDGGAATDASLSNPNGVAVDANGNLFIADTFNHRIRKVTTNGIIMTVAGNGTNGYFGDGGAATNTSLSYPNGVTLDACGNLFIADSANSRIRKVTTNGMITTVAGNGLFTHSGDSGSATNASLSNPNGVAVDAKGNLFIADSYNHVVREVNFDYGHQSTLTLNHVLAGQSGNYSVVVANAAGSIISSTNAVLTVLVPTNAVAGGPHYVFAHYMVCYATYGDFAANTNLTIAGYKREIQEAQAAGIDGFVLDVGAWNDPSLVYYNKRVALIYQAAEQLGTGFKLSFFVEFSNPTNIINLVETFANRTNTFWYQGGIVLSAWGMNNVPTEGWVGLDWTNTVLNPLKSAGYPVFFIPHFWPPYAPETPGYSDAEFLLNQDGSFIQGLFLFGAAGLPCQLAQCNSNYAVALHQAGTTFMGSYCPHYWGNSQPSNGRRYFETDGGEGTILQWTSILADQPDWVNLVTWNDFNESTYSSPVDNPGQYFSQLTTPYRYCHAGYLELSKHYIAWYKTGQEPPINKDALFYFYRTHSTNAVASNTNDIPVTWWFGNIQDTIYTTVFLTFPAQLEINSGGHLSTNTLAAGLQCLRTPFAPGAQTFIVRRSGKVVLSVQGPPILSQIINYDFFPASGYTYGVTNVLQPPINLRATGP